MDTIEALERNNMTFKFSMRQILILIVYTALGMAVWPVYLNFLNLLSLERNIPSHMTPTLTITGGMMGAVIYLSTFTYKWCNSPADLGISTCKGCGRTLSSITTICPKCGNRTVDHEN